eukprot:5277087-Amphidinium_carterae.1
MACVLKGDDSFCTAQLQDVEKSCAAMGQSNGSSWQAACDILGIIVVDRQQQQPAQSTTTSKKLAGGGAGGTRYSLQEANDIQT